MAKVHARHSGAAWRVMLGGAAVAAMLGLAACGSVVAKGSGAAGASRASGTPSGPSASGSPLQGSVPLGAASAVCAAIPHLTSLTVTRVMTLHNQFHFSFPATVKVSDAAQARAVAAAACQLPQLPRVMMTCPADLGVTYRLAFAAAGRAYPPVTAAATGCAKLVGLDVTRKAVPSFWVDLGKAMRLASPGAPAFAGNPG
jgi:hypothetical protein